MTDDINLQSVEQHNVTASQKNIFALMTTCLPGPEEQSSKSVKLADEIRRLGASSEDVSLFLWDLWMIVVDIAFLTPADHPWQDVLVGAVENLRQTGGCAANLQQVYNPIFFSHSQC